MQGFHYRIEGDIVYGDVLFVAIRQITQLTQIALVEGRCGCIVCLGFGSNEYGRFVERDTIPDHETVGVADICSGMSCVRVDDDRRRGNAKTGHQELFHFYRLTIRASERITEAAADDDKGRPVVSIPVSGYGAVQLVVGADRRGG